MHRKVGVSTGHEGAVCDETSILTVDVAKTVGPRNRLGELLAMNGYFVVCGGRGKVQHLKIGEH